MKNTKVLSFEEVFNLLKSEKNKLNNLAYEYLCALFHLELSAFDTYQSNFISDSDLYNHVIKYNIWHTTNNRLKSINNACSLKEDKTGNGVVLLNNIDIVKLNFDSVLFPVCIFVNCYENDRYKDTLYFLKNKKISLIKAYNEYINADKLIPSCHEEAVAFSKMQREMLSSIRDLTYQINRIEENIPLYEDKLYREVSYEFLEEYNVPNEIGKTKSKTYNFGKVIRCSK